MPKTNTKQTSKRAALRHPKSFVTVEQEKPAKQPREAL